MKVITPWKNWLKNAIRGVSLSWDFKIYGGESDSIDNGDEIVEDNGGNNREEGVIILDEMVSVY